MAGRASNHDRRAGCRRPTGGGCQVAGVKPSRAAGPDLSGSKAGAARAPARESHRIFGAVWVGLQVNPSVTLLYFCTQLDAVVFTRLPACQRQAIFLLISAMTFANSAMFSAKM